MKFRILQLKFNNKTKDCRFLDYESAIKNKPDLSVRDYELTYEGSCESEGKPDYEVLDHLFYIFNMKRPDDYKGHSLSVSDVIMLNDTYYYVNTFGYKMLDKEFEDGGR